MTILDTDIKLRESERMTDTPDGGGRRTNRLVLDGVAGNVFPKVSRVDSVYGRVNFRKLYGHVDTANLDMYAGAHAVITDAPDNDRIHVCLFSTGSDFDQRTAARDRVESFVISGPASRMTLYGRQLAGTQALLAYQRVEEPLPEVGDVYAISTESAGLTVNQQFVRIQDMTHEVRTFTDDINGGAGEFTRRVLTLKIGASLRYEFAGLASPSRFSNIVPSAVLRSTTVADAARYYGLQPLTEEGVIGALALRVNSVYTPIVPTTQREAPLPLASIAGAANLQPTAAAATGFGSVVFVNAHSVTQTQTVRLPRSVAPGTLQVRFGTPGLSVFTTVNVPASGVIPPGEIPSQSEYIDGGLVDHESGIVTLRTRFRNGWGGAYALSYVPAAEVTQSAHTREIPITLGTRGTVYTPVLVPVPAPGTLIVDFRALGKWYRLRDNGNGELSGGDAAYGAGTIDYVTGGVIVTLGALPDVGSSVLLAWGSPAHYEIQAGATSDAGTTVSQTLQLTATPVAPNTTTVAWTSGGVSKTATESGAVLTGAATGSLDATTGELKINYGAFIPDAGTSVSVTHNQLVASGATPVSVGGYRMVGDPANILLDSPIVPGSLSILAVGKVPTDATLQEYQIYLADDGAGKMVTLALTATQAVVIVDKGLHMVQGGQVVGTVNYGTGVVSLAGSANLTWSDWVDGAWAQAAGAFTFSSNAYFVGFRTGAPFNPVASTQTFDPQSAAAPLQIDFTRTVARAVVPGSLLFSFTGKTYIDRNGTLYTDLNPATGSGIEAGTFDYTTGVANITFWANNAASALSVQACLTIYGKWTATEVFFRTAGSPLRPSATYLQVAAADGTLLTGTADQNGAISGPFMRGQVEQSMGVVRAEFGEFVTAAGNELEPWYKLANVVGMQVWKPREAMPDSLRYSTVVLSNLPLNADILGLDPVRLPSDGRVPIYRPADVVVIHHTASYVAGTPAPSATLSVGRAGLAALWLQDAARVKLPRTLYTVNLDAGTATIAADAVFTGYTLPITACHRIEEMGLLSDVQINGQITLSAPLLRTYPLGSFVSSALLFGDQFARVSNVFDQTTWTGAWSDALIGTQSAAQYNDVDHPIEVLNSDALSERWRINFTSTAAFQVIGEQLGVIATGTTGADLQPVNPVTSKPYFTLRAAGWGLGWSVGNQLRFNTVGAAPPFWVARTVLPGATLAGDSFDAQLRGDVD